MKKEVLDRTIRYEQGSYLCGPTHPIDIRATAYIGTLPPDDICDTLCRAVLEVREYNDSALSIHQTDDDLHDTWQVTVYGRPVMILRDQWTHYDLSLFDFPDLPVASWMMAPLGLALESKFKAS